MSAVEAALYKWIVGANERRKALSLPPGLIEDSAATLLKQLEVDYLGRLFGGSEPISILNPEANPLKQWLHSTAIDRHIVELLEFISYLRTFQDDPALRDKLYKLTHDRFWPTFFELAMAARMKRACTPPQTVSLNPESSGSIGDFTLVTSKIKLACECTRLGNSPQIDDPQILGEHLANKVADTTERIPIRLVFKIRSTAALNGATYNVVLRLLRKCLVDIRRSRLPTAHYEGETSACCGELTKNSEPIPFRMVNGIVTNVTGAD